MPDPDAVVVLISGPDARSLEEMAHEIVRDGLAACASVIPGIRSVYRWQNEVRHEDEALAVVKSTRSAVAALRDRVEAVHPYDVPEFLALPVVAGSRGYLDWVRNSVTADEHGKADGQT